ncbi:MAG: aspartate kinase [Clostridiales bacterium]|nr:aspartate kinase [Clostridiales bacterium]
MLIVMKFGGTSVANAERIMNVASRIKRSYNSGNRIAVVLSAQGDTTDGLIDKAHEINRNPSKREMDMLLATGEQQSVALMCMALEKLKVPCISMNASQCHIYATCDYSNARIKDINVRRVENELDAGKVVIVTGFQGVNNRGDVVTLGRGGSDTSAVALAAKLHADLCEIYTDVDGVYTGDPRIISHAKKLKEISYDEMLEFASLGAQVLHNRSVELAKKYGVNLVVRSSLSEAEGTIVKEETKVESMLISGVAVDKNISRISIIGLEDKPGTAYKLFSEMAKKNVSVDIILQSIGRDGRKDISFTVARSDLQAAMDAIDNIRGKIGCQKVDHKENVAKVSIVGAGMATNAGVAALFFEATYSAGVNVNMISTSEIKISILVDEKDADYAANAIHDKFMVQSAVMRQ